MTTKPFYPRFSKRPCLRLFPVSRASRANDEGLTLIECIMAIVVIGITGAAIAPLLLVSVATRVQSQKAEQALELAQSELDRVRVLFEQNTLNNIPPRVTVTVNNANENSAYKVPGPSSVNDTNTRISLVDVNKDGTNDFAVQSYLVPKASVARAYNLGVRVYTFRTLANNAGGNLPVDEARLGMTSTQVETGKLPLATLYSSVAITEDGDAFCNLIDYTTATGTSKKPPSCN